MNEQRFKTTITRSGSRTIVTVPFDPNDVWGPKERHYISGSVNGCGVRRKLGGTGTNFFLSLGPTWLRDNDLEAGAKVDVTLHPTGPKAEYSADHVGNMRKPLIMLVTMMCSLMWATASIGQVINRECSRGNCLSLAIRNSTVVAERTGEFSPGRLVIGKHDARGAGLSSSGEATVFYGRTARGWSALIAAYIPADFLLWPELRLYVFAPNGQRRTVENLYNSLGKPTPNVRIGQIFNSNSEILQVSTMVSTPTLCEL